jgi:hypothetical protein
MGDNNNVTLIDLKYPLSRKKPIMCALPVYESFYSIGQGGIMLKPDKDKEMLYGWHCVSLIGYDDKTKFFKLMNSWSEKWGDKGFFYVSYDWIIEIFEEFYSVDSFC